MGYTLSIFTTVKNEAKLTEIVQFAQTELDELNKTNPNLWELMVDREKCILKWYSLSYKAYDLLEPHLEKIYNHFSDVVFIDQLIADSQHKGTYLIEAGKSTKIQLDVLFLCLKSEEERVKITEFIKNSNNEAFCKANDIEFRLDNETHSPIWIYPISREDIIKEYAKHIITEYPEIQCYFVICDYEDMLWTPNQVCRKNDLDYTWQPVDAFIQDNWDSFHVIADEENEKLTYIDIFEPSERFLKIKRLIAERDIPQF